VHCVPHLAGILLNSKAADFVVTGCRQSCLKTLF
jgi:hypothetical protein